MQPTRQQLINAGKYFQSVDPEGFKRWSKEYNTKSVALAGQYVYICDPDSFETAQTQQ
jgi:hypothetical protein